MVRGGGATCPADKGMATCDPTAASKQRVDYSTLFAGATPQDITGHNMRPSFFLQTRPSDQPQRQEASYKREEGIEQLKQCHTLKEIIEVLNKMEHDYGVIWQALDVASKLTTSENRQEFGSAISQFVRGHVNLDAYAEKLLALFI